MDERRTSRRAFLGDLWFLGGGLVASVAWAWANQPERKPTPVATPETPRTPVARDPRPSPMPTSKKRPDEHDYPDVLGGAVQ